MKALPQSAIKEAIHNIWQQFLAPDSPYAVNVDSKSIDLAREAVNCNNPNRWCFDVAAAHIYHLMERDSYPRYLRSEAYKDFLNCSRKKVKSIPNLFGVKRWSVAPAAALAAAPTTNTVAITTASSASTSSIHTTHHRTQHRQSQD